MDYDVRVDVDGSVKMAAEAMKHFLIPDIDNYHIMQTYENCINRTSK
jgi:hypothetical protein